MLIPIFQISSKQTPYTRHYIISFTNAPSCYWAQNYLEVINVSAVCRSRVKHIRFLLANTSKSQVISLLSFPEHHGVNSEAASSQVSSNVNSLKRLEIHIETFQEFRGHLSSSQGLPKTKIINFFKNIYHQASSFLISPSTLSWKTREMSSVTIVPPFLHTISCQIL